MAVKVGKQKERKVESRVRNCKETEETTDELFILVEFHTDM